VKKAGPYESNGKDRSEESLRHKAAAKANAPA
jgi:hypothetical protein